METIALRHVNVLSAEIEFYFNAITQQLLVYLVFDFPFIKIV